MSSDNTAELVQKAFGSQESTIAEVEQRAKSLFKNDVIVWEADAATFAFSYLKNTIFLKMKLT